MKYLISFITALSTICLTSVTEATTAPYSQIVQKDVKSGATSSSHVWLFLHEWKGNEANLVLGHLIVDASIKPICEINAASDKSVLFSIPLRGHEKDGKIHYHFSIHKELLKGTDISIADTKREDFQALYLARFTVISNDEASNK